MLFILREVTEHAVGVMMCCHHTKLTTREYLLFSDVMGIQWSHQVAGTEQKEVILIVWNSLPHCTNARSFEKWLELLELEISRITKSKGITSGSGSHKKLVAGSVSSRLLTSLDYVGESIWASWILGLSQYSHCHFYILPISAELVFVLTAKSTENFLKKEICIGFGRVVIIIQS